MILDLPPLFDPRLGWGVPELEQGVFQSKQGFNLCGRVYPRAVDARRLLINIHALNFRVVDQEVFVKVYMRGEE